jgi:hypothetical protein
MRRDFFPDLLAQSSSFYENKMSCCEGGCEFKGWNRGKLDITAARISFIVWLGSFKPSHALHYQPLAL